MLNVLMVGPSRSEKGGITTVVNNYFFSEMVEKVNIYYVSTYKKRNKLYKFIISLYAYIKTIILLLFFRIDILHVHLASRGSFYRKSIIILLGCIFRKKIIIHLHGGGFDKFYREESSKYCQYYIKYILNKAHNIIVLSNEWRNKVMGWGIKTEINIIYNGVSVPIKNQYNAFNENKNILFLGMRTREKGFFDLLEGLNQLAKENIDFIFHVGGIGNELYIREFIEKNNLKERVILHGWVDFEKKDFLLKNSQIFVLPSYFEGMPMSILEAMSYGIPVISTNVGGIPTIITSDVDGKLINPGDNDSLIKSIKELLFSEEKKYQISKNSFNKVKENFNVDKQNDKILQIYNQLMKNK